MFYIICDLHKDAILRMDFIYQHDLCYAAVTQATQRDTPHPELWLPQSPFRDRHPNTLKRSTKGGVLKGAHSIGPAPLYYQTQMHPLKGITGIEPNLLDPSAILCHDFTPYGSVLNSRRATGSAQPTEKHIPGNPPYDVNAKATMPKPALEIKHQISLTPPCSLSPLQPMSSLTGLTQIKEMGPQIPETLDPPLIDMAPLMGKEMPGP
jgi:hypothetical protein